MVAINLGRISWTVNRDEEGHRVYNLRSKVRTTDANDGPARVMLASGLPAVGSVWSFGNDYDSWAYCWPTMEVTPILEGEPNRDWEVQQTFSTRPLRRCQDQTVDNPLLEPPKISGSFRRQSKIVEEDMDGVPIRSNTHELIVGIMKDDSKPTVIIEQNLSSISLSNMSSYINTLNDAELWELPARCVKLTNITWSRLLYGLCDFYYTRRLEFNIDTDTFDETKIIDKGFKKFNKKHIPSPSAAQLADPENYIEIRDRNGELATQPLYLDGVGNINNDPTVPVYINSGNPVKIYEENNMLALGIPSVLL